MSEDGKTITTINNSKNAELAQSIASQDPASCIVFQGEDVCGAIYSQFVERWTPLTGDLDKVKETLEGQE